MSGSLRTVGKKYHWIKPNEMKENSKSTFAYFQELIKPKNMRYIGVVRLAGKVELFAIAYGKKEPVDSTWCKTFNISFEDSMRPQGNPNECYEYMKILAEDNHVKYEEHGTWPYKIRQNKEKIEKSGLNGKSKVVPLRIKRKAFLITTKDSKEDMSSTDSLEEVEITEIQDEVESKEIQDDVQAKEIQEEVEAKETHDEVDAKEIQDKVEAKKIQDEVETKERIDLRSKLEQRINKSNESSDSDVQSSALVRKSTDDQIKTAGDVVDKQSEIIVRSSKKVKVNPTKKPHTTLKKIFLHGGTGVKRHECQSFILTRKNAFKMSAPVNYIEAEQRLLEYIKHTKESSDPGRTAKKNVLMAFKHDEDPSAMGSQNTMGEMEQYYSCTLSRDLSLGVYAGAGQSDLKFCTPERIIIIAKCQPENIQEWADWDFRHVSEIDIS